MLVSDLLISGTRQDVSYESYYQHFTGSLKVMVQEWEERLNIRKKDAKLLPFVDVIENSMALAEKINREQK